MSTPVGQPFWHRLLQNPAGGPAGFDLAMLLLRVGFGGLLAFHGLQKVLAYSALRESFADPLGLGICLGHQLLGLSHGAKTFELKFGHRGANQPVLNQLTNRVEITTQNHGFAVQLDDLPTDLEPTHINLNDRTLEGMRHRKLPIFSVQYHPEASAGPHDSAYLFEQFQQMMG